LYTDAEEYDISDIVLQAVLPPPPIAFEGECLDKPTSLSVTGIVSEWGLIQTHYHILDVRIQNLNDLENHPGVVPSHPAVEHVELITWKAPPSRFDVTY